MKPSMVFLVQHLWSIFLMMNWLTSYRHRRGHSTLWELGGNPEFFTIVVVVVVKASFGIKSCIFAGPVVVGTPD